VREGDALRDPARKEGLPVALLDAMARLEASLAIAAPLPLDDAAASAGCPPEGVRALQADGRIVRVGSELAWATPTYHRLAALALDMARKAPLTPAAFRDATETSRRYVLAILEDLDRRGILERTSEGHIPGPRAPRTEPVPAGATR
jgi:Elongation factor SelB, winged helix